MNSSREVITVFGSRYPTENHPDYRDARFLGGQLAEQGFTVCTGGYSGVMEAVSRGAQEAGGHTIGVTVETFSGKHNPYVIEEIRAHNLFARLETLMDLGRAYVIFRGGMGTIAELCLAWNLIQMNQLARQRPIFLLGTHWNDLLACWRDTTDIADEDYQLLRVRNRPEEIVEALIQALR